MLLGFYLLLRVELLFLVNRTPFSSALLVFKSEILELSVVVLRRVRERDKWSRKPWWGWSL